MTEAAIRNEMGMVDALLEMAQLDIVGLWEVIEEFQCRGTPEGDLRQHTLKLVAVLLERGFVAGSAPYPSAGRYEPWPDQRPDRVIDRIRESWDALGHAPSGSGDDFVWFDLPSRPPN